MSRTTNEPGFDTGTPTPPRKAWHARTWVRVTGAVAALIVAGSFGAAAASGSHVTVKQPVPANSAPATTPAAPPPAPPARPGPRGPGPGGPCPGRVHPARRRPDGRDRRHHDDHRQRR